MRSVFMRYPDGKAKAVTFSYDDGVPQDRRLSALFTRYGLKATFNMNNKALREFCYSEEELQQLFLSPGHEIAIHGAFHRPSGNLRPIEEIQDLLNCRLELEERTGQIIRGMAYPDTGITKFGNFGCYEQVKQILTELDIAYSRTLGGDNDEFMLPQDFHAWMPSAHHDNPQILDYIDRFLSLDLSTNTYHAIRMPRLLYIWGHSYEFDDNQNWAHIEHICQMLAHREDLWYATNIEIFDYVEAYRRLIYSANGKKMYNPTLKQLWIDVDGVLYTVHPGETIEILE